MSREQFFVSFVRLKNGLEIPFEVKGFTYRVNRESAPVYSMGRPDARSFSRSRKSVMGTVVLDESAVRLIGKDGFEIIITDTGAGQTHKLSGVELLHIEDLYGASSRYVKSGFIAHSIDVVKLNPESYPRWEKVTNRMMVTLLKGAM